MSRKSWSRIGLTFCVIWSIMENRSPLFEITDDRGNILGVAEVAWVHQKLVLLREDDTENADAFAQQGWTVLMWNELKEELTQKLNDLLTISDPS